MQIDFKKTVLAASIGTALLGVSSLANAYDWSGPYAGGNIAASALTGSTNSYYGDLGSTQIKPTIGFNGVITGKMAHLSMVPR